jgi:hypothetical protein
MTTQRSEKVDVLESQAHDIDEGVLVQSGPGLTSTSPYLRDMFSTGSPCSKIHNIYTPSLE